MVRADVRDLVDQADRAQVSEDRVRDLVDRVLALQGFCLRAQWMLQPDVPPGVRHSAAAAISATKRPRKVR